MFEPQSRKGRQENAENEGDSEEFWATGREAELPMIALKSWKLAALTLAGVFLITALPSDVRAERQDIDKTSPKDIKALCSLLGALQWPST